MLCYNGKQHKDAAWVPHAEIEPEVCGKGVKRRVLAYSKDAMCVENTFETGGVGAMHCHPHTQITYIVSGRYRFTMGTRPARWAPATPCSSRTASCTAASAWKAA